MHRGARLLFAALAVACAPVTSRARAPSQSATGLASAPKCDESTLTAFAPAEGRVRVVRHTRERITERAVVAYEALHCGTLAFERCFEHANEHAQQRASEHGLSARLLPPDSQREKVVVAYIERERRARWVAAADVEYELSGSGRARRRALGDLYDDLERAGIELHPESDRELRAILAAPDGSELPLVDPVEDARLAVPSLPAAPLVIELALRCQPQPFSAPDS